MTGSRSGDPQLLPIPLRRGRLRPQGSLGQTRERSCVPPAGSQLRRPSPSRQGRPGARGVIVLTVNPFGETLEAPRT
ncbi:hypothetical protein E0L36_13075 [Streptomyces sp. AJS327]|nr:hypothetical protein [Streptomyces sp. AJS327]